MGDFGPIWVCMVNDLITCDLSHSEMVYQCIAKKKLRNHARFSDAYWSKCFLLEQKCGIDTGELSVWEALGIQYVDCRTKAKKSNAFS